MVHAAERIVLRITLLLILFIFATAPAVAQPEGEFGPWPFPLSVDPLPNNMQQGKPFQGFPTYQRNVDWMIVPPWLVGDWQSRDYRTLKAFDHTTGTLHTIPRGSVSPMADHFGDQQDKQGTVWNCNVTPYILESPINDQVGLEYTISLKPLDLKPDQLTLWQRVIHAIIDSSRIILDAYTEERVTQFTPADSGQVLAQATSRFYDTSGTAYRTSTSVRVMRLASPFKPLNQRLGVNLPMSFYEFLQTSGRTELLPTQQQ